MYQSSKSQPQYTSTINHSHTNNSQPLASSIGMFATTTNVTKSTGCSQRLDPKIFSYKGYETDQMEETLKMFPLLANFLGRKIFEYRFFQLESMENRVKENPLLAQVLGAKIFDCKDYELSVMEDRLKDHPILAQSLGAKIFDYKDYELRWMEERLKDHPLLVKAFTITTNTENDVTTDSMQTSRLKP